MVLHVEDNLSNSQTTLPSNVCNLDSFFSWYFKQVIILGQVCNVIHSLFFLYKLEIRDNCNLKELQNNLVICQKFM